MRTLAFELTSFASEEHEQEFFEKAAKFLGEFEVSEIQRGDGKRFWMFPHAAKARELCSLATGSLEADPAHEFNTHQGIERTLPFLRWFLRSGYFPLLLVLLALALGTLGEKRNWSLLTGLAGVLLIAASGQLLVVLVELVALGAEHRLEVAFGATFAASCWLVVKYSRASKKTKAILKLSTGAVQFAVGLRELFYADEPFLKVLGAGLAISAIFLRAGDGLAELLPNKSDQVTPNAADEIDVLFITIIDIEHQALLIGEILRAFAMQPHKECIVQRIRT